MAGEVEALLKRADEAFQKRNYDYARDLYMTVVAKEPNNEKGHLGLFGTCVTKIKEQGGKGKLSQMAGEKMFQGQMMTVKSNPAKRVDISLKYLMDDPNNSRARTALASGYADQNIWVGAAINAEIAFKIDNKNVEAAKIMVLGLTKQGKIKEAQDILQKVQSMAGDDRDIEKLQRELAAQESAKAFDGKTDDYRKSLKNKGQAAQLEKNTQLIKTEEDFVAFIEYMTEQMAANPNDYHMPQKVAQTYFDFKKDYKTAKGFFAKAATINPQDTTLKDKVEDCDLRLWDAQVEAAKAANAANLKELMQGRLQAMIAAFQRRVADRPTDMAIRFELGKAYYLGGLTDKAMAEFQQASKDPKKKVMSHYYLGICFAKKKMYDLSDGQFAKAEEAGAGVLQQNLLLDIWYNRAKILAEAGKKEKAKEFGAKIMEVDIGFKDIGGLMDEWNQ